MSVRPLRGQVVVRELTEAAPRGLWMPPVNPREQRTHRGVVLAMGPPVLTSEGHEIAHGFQVGDRVQFHFEAHEGGRTRAWEDGEPAVWLAQREIDAVVE